MQEFEYLAMDAMEVWIDEKKRNYVDALCAKRRGRCQAARWFAAKHRSVLLNARFPKPRGERRWIPLVRVFCVILVAEVLEQVKKIPSMLSPAYFAITTGTPNSSARQVRIFWNARPLLPPLSSCHSHRLVRLKNLTKSNNKKTSGNSRTVRSGGSSNEF